MAIRVLIVDDSVIARRAIVGALITDPRFTVVGEAPDGFEAVKNIWQSNPDVVILDLVMPTMDGIETMALLRRRKPDLKIIMCTKLGGVGTAAAADALMLGADDCVAKPVDLDTMGAHHSDLHKLLAFRIADLFQDLPSANVPVSHSRKFVPEVVVIGVSTGGPNALATLLPMLPHDFPLPILIVQHIPSEFVELLAQRLSLRANLPVQEAREGERVSPGRILIAPGGHHLALRRHGAGVSVAITDQAKENSCRPSVDVLFRNAVQAYGGGVLGVIMTGMGSDGTRGAIAINQAGGVVLVQDKPSSVVWGMPGSAVDAGVVNEVLPLSQLAPAIIKRSSAFPAGKHHIYGRRPALMNSLSKLSET